MNYAVFIKPIANGVPLLKKLNTDSGSIYYPFVYSKTIHHLYFSCQKLIHLLYLGKMTCLNLSKNQKLFASLKMLKTVQIRFFII